MPASRRCAPARSPTAASAAGADRRGGGERGAEAQAALAAELGKTTEELTAARQTAHDAVVAELGEMTRPESRPETDEEREALKAQLQERRALENTKFAEALGISVDDLKAARIAVVQDELNAKVAAGEMTQEEADAKIQALQDGELPDGSGSGRWPRVVATAASVAAADPPHPRGSQPEQVAGSPAACSASVRRSVGRSVGQAGQGPGPWRGRSRRWPARVRPGAG